MHLVVEHFELPINAIRRTAGSQKVSITSSNPLVPRMTSVLGMAPNHGVEINLNFITVLESQCL